MKTAVQDPNILIPCISIFDELPSTSDYLKQHSECWSSNFYTVCARRQTNGRGRNSHTWSMQDKKDLTFTMVFHFAGTPAEVIALTPYVGLALQQILTHIVANEPHPQKPFTVKWPNDILVDGKKICGILCECVGTQEVRGVSFRNPVVALSMEGQSATGTQEVRGVSFRNPVVALSTMAVQDELPRRQTTSPVNIILIGVGMNINSEAHENDPMATSLKSLTGHTWPLDKLSEEIVFSLAKNLEAVRIPYSPEFCAEWYKHCAHPHAHVSWLSGEKTLSGVVTGLDPNGRLLVQDSLYKVHAVSQNISSIHERGIHHV